MSTSFRFMAVSAVAVVLAACAPSENNATAADKKVELTTDQAKFGYAVGVSIGQSLEQAKDEITLDALNRGISDVFADADLAMTEEEREQIQQTVSERIRAKIMAEREAKAAAAVEAGKKYLEDNGKREGVVTTASGLQYEVMAAGEGASPTAADRVTVHYKGTLIDGKVFDSSYDRGEPVTFPLGGVIPGWTEGVQLMKPGAKYKFFIPSELAYGSRGAGQSIGPNETLIFEVELISFEKGEDEQPEGHPHN